MDFEHGTIIIDNIKIGPGYSFDDFCSSPFYKGQDGIKIIYIDGIKKIENNQYIISLFFREKALYMLSLICCDKQFTPTTEEERKKLHDLILSKFSIVDEKIFIGEKLHQSTIEEAT